MDYVFCVRSTRNGAFGSDAGPTKFLKIPANVRRPDPAHRITKSDWFREVTELSRHGPQNEMPVGDVLLYVHGFNTPQEVMLERHRLLRAGLEELGYEGAVASFDWPCADNALNYLKDRTTAKLTALRLVSEGITSFAALQRPDCRINVHILAHSMGAYVVREAFDDADDRPAVAARAWSVSQVMLISGDISDSSMAASNPKSSSLYRHCVRLTNYYNPFDEILSLSNIKRVGVAQRAGRIGLPDGAPDKAVDVYCGEYYKTHRARFAGLTFPTHTWYFHDRRLMEDMLFTIRGDIDRNEFPTRRPTDRGNLALHD
ncbi:MAG: alpha/beta hydrolase [Paracoccaceae bacterium]